MDGASPWVQNWGSYRGALHSQHQRDYPDCYMDVPAKEPIPITWAYALTAHKAQGSEWRRVTVFLSNADINNSYFFKNTALPDGSKMKFAMRWIYTAITRAREQVTIVIGPE